MFTFALTEATGAYTFTLSAPIDQDESGPPNSAGEGVFSFSSLSSLLTATDADGSSVTAAPGALTLAIIDDQPTDSTATVTATVDEDALVSVTPGETGFTGTATGNVSSLFNPGVDLPLTYRLSGSTSGLPTLTSGGNAVTYSLSSAAGVDTLTASYTIGTTTTTVFTFALTEATGAYTFTLSAPIDQDESGPPNSAGEGVFSFSSLSPLLTATDADGSSVTAAPGALTLAIIDDQPTATTTKQTATVDEDALVSVTPGETGFTGTATGNVSSLFNPGADTPLKFTLSTTTTGLPTLTSDGVAVTYKVTTLNWVDTLTASAGAATVFTFALTEATGAYTFTLSAPIDQDESGPPNSAGEGVFSFSSLSSLLTATDADGSSVTAAPGALTLAIIDDQPTFITTLVLVRDHGRGCAFDQSAGRHGRNHRDRLGFGLVALQAGRRHAAQIHAVEPYDQPGEPEPHVARDGADLYRCE